MSTSATTTWRAWPDGNAFNGAGFDATVSAASVDYSQQAAAQLTVTDGASVGPGTTITSVTGGFTQAMLGNYVGIVIAGPTFSGHWRITAVTDSNTITVDRNAPATSGMTLRVGGAGIISSGCTFMTNSASIVAGNIVWVKAGAYSVSSTAFQTTTNGTALLPIVVKGYNTVDGDLDDDPSLARPVLTYSASAISVISLPGNHHHYSNLEVVNGANTNPGVLISGISCQVENVKVTTTVDATGIDCTGTRATVRRCYVIAGTGASEGIRLRGTGGHLCEDNHVTSASATVNTHSGIESDIGGNFIHRNIVQHFTNGVWMASSTQAGSVIENNVLHRCTNGIHIQTAAQGATALSRVSTNIFSRLTRGVYYANSDISANFSTIKWFLRVVDCNFFYSVTNNFVQFPPGGNSTTLTADPFTDETGSDFSLNGAIGGGALVRSTVCRSLFGDNINSATTYAGIGVPAVTSDLQTMIDLFRELTGEKFSPQLTDETIASKYLQGGAEELNRIAGYHFETSTTDIVLVAGTQEYVTPATWCEVRFVQLGSKEIEKGDIEQWRSDNSDWRNEPAGFPKQWAHYGNRLVFRPAPNAATVAAAASPVVRVVTVPPDMFTNGPDQCPTQAHRLIVLHAVALWSGCYPDSALAGMRRDTTQAAFEKGAEAFAVEFLRRGISR